MTTARSIIEKAHRKLGVLGAGETLSAEDANSGLEALNDLLGLWSVEGGLVFTQTRETFNSTGALSYTIGAGGDFNTSRPVDISNIYLSSGGTDYPVSKMTKKEYADISTKSTNGLAYRYYYDGNYPLGNIFFYPAPSTYTITIFSEKPLEEFTGLTDDIELGVGYVHALVYNLAIELAPEFEKEPSPTVVRVAGESKAAVFSANEKNNVQNATPDNALLGNSGYGLYNINRGY